MQKFAVITDQGQDAVAGAMRTWAQSVQQLSSLPGTPTADPLAAVDKFFDFAEQVLAAQRELAKAVLSVVLSVSRGELGELGEIGQFGQFGGTGR